VLWLIVAFGAGIAVYFGLGIEPPFWLALMVAVPGAICAVAGVRVGRAGLAFLLGAVAAAAFGFATAKLRTDTVAAPVIAREIGPVLIEGRVESISAQANNRTRVVIVPSHVARLAKEKTPRKLRISLRSKAAADLAPGHWIALSAVLRPPPEPAVPGGYDFARWAFFEGIGGVGFAFGGPRPLAPPRADTLLERAATTMENLRRSMNARIRAALPQPDGAIAAALITGERGPIPDSDEAAYRDSGLTHVLSISGLHMALAGFGLFFIVRAILALFPAIALHYPIKKWAAVAALGGATFYLLISGGATPTVRSFIMLVVMLVAILLDRPALSMRSVAIAAFMILAFEPESLTEPGFQMSFAAVAGLIAMAEWQAARPRREDTVPGVVRVARRYVVGLAAASIVAGLATAPFAIFHFNRASGYSLLANLAAMPIVGAVIMPAAALAVVAMPFGLEYWPLQAMGWGVRRMTDIAHWVADLPGAVSLVPSWPVSALLMVSAGGLWLVLWRRRWRWAGTVAIAGGVAWGALNAAPDLVVARDAHSVALRAADGKLVLLGSKIDDYAASQWLAQDGDTRAPADARTDASHCDDRGCVARAANGERVALSLRASAVAEDCARADVVVAAAPIRVPCEGPRIVIDRFAVLRHGAHAIWLGKDIRVETVADTRGKRPWSAGR